MGICQYQSLHSTNTSTQFCIGFGGELCEHTIATLNTYGKWKKKQQNKTYEICNRYPSTNAFNNNTNSTHE